MRKKIYLIILLLTSSLCSCLQAQRIQGMLILGGNIAQVDGDHVYGFNKYGINAGIGALAPLGATGIWRASAELLFSQRGSKETIEPYIYNCQLNYVDVPILLHIFDPKGKWTFGAGAQYGRLFSLTEDITLPNPAQANMERPVMDNRPDFLRDDISLLADLRFTIWRHLKFNIRFQYSLIPIRRNALYNNSFAPHSQQYREWSRDSYNNWFSVRLLYMFNERKETDLDRNIKPTMF